MDARIQLFGRFSAITLSVAIVATLSATRPATAAEGSFPSSMASTGDSITRAFNSGSAFVDNPAASWSTGDAATVGSHYTRLLALNPAIAGRTYNHAVSGAKMADLDAQLVGVNARRVDYVTVLMGGNDVCAPSETGMTSVSAVRSQFGAAMRTITTGSPATRIYVVSIPDVFNLWTILKNNASARFAWSLFGICQSMLASPLSTAQLDIDRRARVRQRNIDFNLQLAQVCALYTRCRFDGNAVFNTAFTTADVSTRDYFHPSIAGQTKLASVSWLAGYWGSPAIGGRGFGLTTGGQMTWTGGVLQTGYLIARYSETGADVLPSADSPLPPTAVTYSDGLPSTGLACYQLFALGGGGTLGNSDVLCKVNNVAAGAAPGNFTVRLNESSLASFSWSPPGSQDAYALLALGGQFITLGGTATTASMSIAAPTCFLLLAFTGAELLGQTDVLCAFPGYAYFGAAPAPAVDQMLKLRQALKGATAPMRVQPPAGRRAND